MLRKFAAEHFLCCTKNVLRIGTGDVDFYTDGTLVFDADLLATLCCAADFSEDAEVALLRTDLDRLVFRVQRFQTFLSVDLDISFISYDEGANFSRLQIRSILNEEQRTMPYAADDLKYLYNRVQMRNNRLKMLMEVNAPEIVIRNEKRALQETADTLIANGKRGYTIMRTGTENDEIRMQSLTDVILRNTKLV